MTNVIIETNKTETETTYKIGDFFLVDGQDLCQLVHSGDCLCFLSNVHAGNRCLDPQKVKDPGKITICELSNMTSCTIEYIKSVKISYEL